MKKTRVLAAAAATFLLTTPAFPRGEQTSKTTQHKGAQSEDARKIQTALRDAGFNPGPVDGVIGPRTRTALRNFQTAHNLQPTGQPNQDTLAALNVSFEGGGIGATGGREEPGKQPSQKKSEQQKEAPKGDVGAQGMREGGKSYQKGSEHQSDDSRYDGAKGESP